MLRIVKNWIYVKWCKAVFMYKWHRRLTPEQRKDFYVRMRFIQDTSEKTGKHPVEIMKGMETLGKMSDKEEKKDEMD